MQHFLKPLLASWPVWAVLAAVFAAMTAILAKIGTSQVDPDYAMMVRTLVIAAFAILIVAATDAWQSPRALGPRTLFFLVLSGLATGASWLCYFRALKLGDAARVAPLDKLSVPLVAIIAVIFLGEKLSAINWLGVVLISLGALLVAWNG